MSYSWRVEIAVWAYKRQDESVSETFSPRLCLVSNPAKDGRVIGWIDYEPASADTILAGWNAHYIDPADRSIEDRHTTLYDKGRKGRPMLAQGEVKRPRDSASEALAALLQMAQSEIDAAHRGALAKVGPALLPPLIAAVDQFVRRFEPKPILTNPRRRP